MALTGTQAHVVLCGKPVTWKFPPMITSRVFYDNLHTEIVVIADGKCYSSNFATGSLFEYPFTFALDTRVVIDAKFSPAREYFLIQSAPTEIVFIYFMVVKI